MATATASVSMATTALTRAVVAGDSAVHMSSFASLGSKRLSNSNAAAQRSVHRSARTAVVRAEKIFWDNITGIFNSSKQQASDAAKQGEKELNKASSEAKSSSKDLGKKAESLKDDLQAQAEEAADKVKTGVEGLKEKVEEAVESAQSK